MHCLSIAVNLIFILVSWPSSVFVAQPQHDIWASARKNLQSDTCDQQILKPAIRYEKGISLDSLEAVEGTCD